MVGTILVVDDEVLFARSVSRLLQHQGYHSVVAHTGADARSTMASLQPDIVLLDLQLPDADGSDLLAEFKGSYPSTAFIIITAHGSIPSAVRSTLGGASDYLTKPVMPDDVFAAVRNVMQRETMKEEVRRLRSDTVQEASRDRGLLSYPSIAMQRVLAKGLKAARQDSIVLLLGDSGTGKDHMARWIHRHSARHDGPFFSINCAALPRELAESELFGHEPGAFTGARTRKRGLLELAEKGSLLLDEVGELDLALQSKLLTFLDTRSFMRIGSERTTRIDARLLAATNRDLAADVERGTFRRDLFYRLNVFPISLPPLRERVEDIPILVDEIFDKLVSELRLKGTPTLGPGVLDRLQRYAWPGNVRELRNVLERALMLSTDAVIRRDDLSLEQAECESFSMTVGFTQGRSLHDVTRDVARRLVLEAIRQGGSKQAASRLLGISRHALAYQLRTLNIDAPGEPDGP